MLDELFEVFERDNKGGRRRRGGIRGALGRAIAGDDRERDDRYRDDDRGDTGDEPERRRDDDDGDERRRHGRKRRFSDLLDVD